MLKCLTILPFLLLVLDYSDAGLILPVIKTDNHCYPRHYGYTSYQTGIYCASCYPVQHPTSLEEVQLLVNYALTQGIGVKAFGSRHSISDIICTDGIPISMKKINWIKVNEDDTVSVGTGAELTFVFEELHKFKKTLGLTASFGGITVGGSLGVGAQTSSVNHDNSLSDYLVEVTVVDGLGNVQIITDPDDLLAFGVNLGLLGIVVEAKFKTIPEFKMHIHNFGISDKVLYSDEAANMARAKDWLQMYWFPNVDKVVVASGTFVPATVPGDVRSSFFPNFYPWSAGFTSYVYEMLQKFKLPYLLRWVERYVYASFLLRLPLKPTILTENGWRKNPGVGFTDRLVTSHCKGDDFGGFKKCAWSQNPKLPKTISFLPEYYIFSFPIQRLPDVIRAFKIIIKEYEISFPLIGIEILFAVKGKQLMKLNYGREGCAMVWTVPRRHDPFNTPRHGITGLQMMAQLAHFRFGGRVHWGASGMAFHMKSEVGWDKNFPDENLHKFKAQMVKMDPHGVFLNNYGRRFLGISEEVDYGPFVKHCALQDHCLCKTDSDCGAGLKCSIVEGLHLCHDPKRFPKIPPTPGYY